MGDQLVLLRDGGAVAGAPIDLVQSGDERIAEFLGPEGAELASHGAGTSPPGAESR